MTKTQRITGILLALILCLLLLSPTAFAKVADPPKTNGILDAITVSVPYYPSLEITLTNVGYLAGEINGGTHYQTKIYCAADTVVSFNRDVAIGTMSGTPTAVKAGESIKPMSVASGNEVGMMIVVEKSGNVRYPTGSTINYSAGDTLYRLSFAAAKWYESNVAEGYTMKDVRKWQEQIYVGPTLTKTSNGGVKVAADYEGDGTVEFSYTVPNVAKTEKVSVAKTLADATDESLASIAGAKLNMLTVKTGAKINLGGGFAYAADRLSYANGVLNNGIGLDTDEFDKAMRVGDANGQKRRVTSNGVAESAYANDVTFEFLKEGYYIFALVPFHPAQIVTDPASSDYRNAYYSLAYWYNAVVVHVVK